MRSAPMGDYNPGAVVVAPFSNHYPVGLSLLFHDGSQLAQEQLTRGDGLGESQCQELRQNRRLRLLFGRRAAIKALQRIFDTRQIDARAKLAKSVDGSRQVLDRSGRSAGGIGPSQLVMRASSTITIA